mgnify:FL=1
MKLSTEKKIEIIVGQQMQSVRKLKKAELFEVLQDILSDYMREMPDDVLNDMYNDVFFGVK